MILLAARNLARQFDAEPVFSHVTFDVRPGDRIGLVGPNGTGKTTLINILAELDHADVGTVEKHPQAEISLLEQHAEFDADQTLIAEARKGLAHLYELQQQSLDLAEKMGEVHGDELAKLQKRFDHIQHELEQQDAYHVEHRIDEVLGGLGFTQEDYERPLSEFSGGQQNRVLLARLLLRNPDVMLLDEPTNHLDIAATEWLEDYLSRTDRAVILVSHDRYFLDRVTNRIVELHRGKVSLYKGNFSAYWLQREERAKVASRTVEKQQDYIARQEDFIRRNQYGQKHAQAADRKKKLERLDIAETVDDFMSLPMGFPEPVRSGDWVIDAENIDQGFDELLVRDFTHRIHRGDRVAILGPNGSGKTTMLRTLIGELPPKAGKLRFGSQVHLAYYDQQLASVDPKLDAIEATRPAHKPEMTPAELRKILARFGIRGDQVFQTIASMSGGEKSKVALARIAALDANVLVLDEPTNHLDLWARSSLEDTLKSFGGTLLFVSHDRYFVNQVATNVIVLEPDGWKFHEGNYSDYLEFRAAIGRPPAAVTVTSMNHSLTSETSTSAEPASTGDKSGKKEKDKQRKRKFPYRKVAEIEADIAETEELIESLQADLGDADVHRDATRMRETMDAYEEANQRLEELYEHWEEASELNG